MHRVGQKLHIFNLPYRCDRHNKIEGISSKCLECKRIEMKLQFFVAVTDFNLNDFYIYLNTSHHINTVSPHYLVKLDIFEITVIQ